MMPAPALLAKGAQAVVISVDSVNAKPLNKAMIGWFFDKTVNSVADKSDPRLDIIHAKLSLLPPVTIINAQIDPLRSDGAMLEEALKQVNVKVTRKEYEGRDTRFLWCRSSPAGRQEGADFRRRAAQGGVRGVVAKAPRVATDERGDECCRRERD